MDDIFGDQLSMRVNHYQFILYVVGVLMKYLAFRVFYLMEFPPLLLYRLHRKGIIILYYKQCNIGVFCC